MFQGLYWHDIVSNKSSLKYMPIWLVNGIRVDLRPLSPRLVMNYTTY